MDKTKIDLLETVEYGGCSAKLDPKELSHLLADIPILKDNNILVDSSSFDDAGVYKINEDLALIFTTDFFPPVCSDPYTFGKIAATNAISDVYAMGGKPLMALNIVMYPQKKLPLHGLKEIMRGGSDVMIECGCITMGGHTIEDDVPKYGLAVIGTVNPKQMTTNASAKAGQILILTKPLGIGVAIAAHRMGMISDSHYNEAIETMIASNKKSAEIMNKYNISTATDITGFGLVGHARNIARASNVSIKIYSDEIPFISGTLDLISKGCIPGATFRNIKYAGDDLLLKCTTDFKYLVADPETSGGILMCVEPSDAMDIINDLHNAGCLQSKIIGEVCDDEQYKIIVL